MRINVTRAGGYVSDVYTLQDDIVVKMYSPSEYAYIGEIVCKAKSWNLLSKEKCWYIPIPIEEKDIFLRMKQVLMAYI